MTEQTTNNGDMSSRWDQLRQRAEAILAQRGRPDADAGREDLFELLQEIQISQIELELQNEELLQTQDRLQISRQHFRELFHQAPVGYLVLDEKGLVIQANETFCHMVQQSEDKLKGVLFGRLVAPSARRPLERSMPGLFREQGRIALETTLLATEADATLEVRLDGKAINWETGETDRPTAPSYLLSVTDISDAKSLQHQLWEAQKLETVGRLAGGVAHDFNNALMVIQGTVDVARDEWSGGPQELEFLNQIDKATQRAAELVKHLLSFARRGVAVPQVIQTAQFMAKAEIMLARLLPEHQELEVLLEKDLHPVYLDPVQLDQILTNLLLNARDAMDGAGKITMCCRNVLLDSESCRTNPAALPGSYLEISIQDTGRGMDTETVDRVFEPFFTTKPLGQGTGLGLSTVYGIVVQNSGLITVTSEVGSGTTFTLQLPRSQVRPPRPLVDAGQDSYLGGDESILVIEDDELILSLISRVLARKGYRIKTFDHPPEALAWFAQNLSVVDLVISDMIMPDMSGRQVVDAMREMRHDLPCVFISGYSEEDLKTHETGSEAGETLVPKPFDSVTLLRAVRQALGD